MSRNPRQSIALNIKLTKTEVPRSADPTRIKVIWFFLFLPPGLGNGGTRRDELPFLTLIKACELRVVSTLPFERGNFFFQQVSDLKIATAHKQSEKQDSLQPSAVKG
jgi:hypothetical protein